jgi:hypothetical protein
MRGRGLCVSSRTGVWLQFYAVHVPMAGKLFACCAEQSCRSLHRQACVASVHQGACILQCDVSASVACCCSTILPSDTTAVADSGADAAPFCAVGCLLAW